jgi:hypothetical protein
VGGGVQLGLLVTAATNRPIVPAPGDYDNGEIGGMMIGREPQYSEKTCPSAALSITNPARCLDANLGRCGGKPATNCLSYGTAFCATLTWWTIVDNGEHIDEDGDAIRDWQTQQSSCYGIRRVEYEASDQHKH